MPVYLHKGYVSLVFTCGVTLFSIIYVRNKIRLASKIMVFLLNNDIYLSYAYK